MRTTRSTIASASTSAPSTIPARRRRVAGLAVALVAGAAITGGALGTSPASAQTVKLGCAPTVIHVKAGQKTVTGTCGDDLIFVGGNNNVYVNSLGGNDDIRGGWGDGYLVTIDSGPGNDSISVNRGKRLIADGGSGNDVIVGGNLDDVINGNDGDDHIIGGLGWDIADWQVGDVKDASVEGGNAHA